mgnify:CR=1 FL=1
MLRLDGVTKEFRGQTVIHTMDLAVRRGETKVLLGTSGCGKSTLLRLMIGLIEPTTGSAWFDGQPIATDNLLIVRRRIGYVIQDGGLFPHLTARANATSATTTMLLARHSGRMDLGSPFYTGHPRARGLPKSP